MNLFLFNWFNMNIGIIDLLYYVVEHFFLSRNSAPNCITVIYECFPVYKACYFHCTAWRKQLVSLI